jgi:tRNA threonylcarbamoyladenosine biosynthesis protein TsaB
VDEADRLALEYVNAVPLLLAVETATAAPSVALWRADALIGERAADPSRPTAEGLLPAIDALLRDANAVLAAVDGFAVSIGPGSFTGLRIGVATVKGLAFGTGRRAIAVPTLAAIAAHAPGPAPVAAVLDARRGEVYAAGFERGRAADWLEQQVIAISALAARLPAGCRVVGDGAALCAEALRDPAALLPPPYPATTARHVAQIAAGAWSRGEAIPAGELVPRYLRRAEAEVKRTGLRFEPKEAES